MDEQVSAIGAAQNLLSHVPGECLRSFIPINDLSLKIYEAHAVWHGIAKALKKLRVKLRHPHS
jgi:hypothetical protein